MRERQYLPPVLAFSGETAKRQSASEADHFYQAP
jgi:hypothetical protein